MKIGFTGTREGMTSLQKEAFATELIFTLDIDEFHHGDCIGSDDEAHYIASSCGIEIYIHPCTIKHLRANNISHNILSAKDPLDRNMDIVDSTDILIATPKGPEEVRSGTWMTIRYAIRQEKPVIVIYPDGIKVEYKRVKVGPDFKVYGTPGL